MAHFNFVISQNAKWGHAGFYIDCHRMTVPENILLQKSTVYQRPTPLPWVGPIGAFCRHTYRTLHIAVVCRLQYLPMLSAGRKAPKIAPSRGQSGPPPHTWFLWPLSPSHANGISIASSVFVGLTVVTNRHRHTNPRYTTVACDAA